MRVKFICNQFMLPYMRVKARYRELGDTLFDRNAPNDRCMFVMVYKYTQEEYN